jgi:hypothetical protein
LTILRPIFKRNAPKSLDDIKADIQKECDGCATITQEQINAHQLAWVEQTIKDHPELEPYLKPFANEHSCRLISPGQFERFARKNCQQKHDGKCIDAIFGIKAGKSKIQALRYKKDVWTVAAARKHCKNRKGILFEPAKELEQESQTIINNVTISGSDGALKELTEAIKELNVNVKDLKSSLPNPDPQNAGAGGGGKPERRDYDLKLDPLKLQ